MESSSSLGYPRWSSIRWSSIDDAAKELTPVEYLKEKYATNPASSKTEKFVRDVNLLIAKIKDLISFKGEARQRTVKELSAIVKIINNNYSEQGTTVDFRRQIDGKLAKIYEIVLLIDKTKGKQNIDDLSNLQKVLRELREKSLTQIHKDESDALKSKKPTPLMEVKFPEEELNILDEHSRITQTEITRKFQEKSFNEKKHQLMGKLTFTTELPASRQKRDLMLKLKNLKYDSDDAEAKFNQISQEAGQLSQPSETHGVGSISQEGEEEVQSSGKVNQLPDERLVNSVESKKRSSFQSKIFTLMGELRRNMFQSPVKINNLLTRLGDLIASDKYSNDEEDKFTQISQEADQLLNPKHQAVQAELKTKIKEKNGSSEHTVESQSSETHGVDSISQKGEEEVELPQPSQTGPSLPLSEDEERVTDLKKSREPEGEMDQI